jgi:hypothetical protein
LNNIYSQYSSIIIFNASLLTFLIVKIMIDKYKKGELSENEMEQIEDDLLHQMLRKQQEGNLRSDLKKLAASLNEEESLQTNEIKKNNTSTEGLKVVHRANRSWTWLAAAASVVLLAVASWWIFIKPSSNNLEDEALAMTYLKADKPPVWSTTMNNSILEERENKAKEAYQNADFTNVINLLASMPPSKKEHFFYIGVAYLKQPQMDAAKAIDNLSKARALADGWQEDNLNWYLALAYIHAKNTTEARKELNNIIRIGRDNVARSELLLSELK